MRHLPQQLSSLCGAEHHLIRESKQSEELTFLLLLLHPPARGAPSFRSSFYDANMSRQRNGRIPSVDYESVVQEHEILSKKQQFDC